MAKIKKVEALKLPDQLLVRYFREGEIENIATVSIGDGKPGGAGKVCVLLKFPKGPRIDHWTDLGGGLGFVPDVTGD